LKQQRDSCEQNLAIGGMNSQSSDARPAAVVTVRSDRAAERPAKLCPGGPTVSRFEYAGPIIAIAAEIFLAGSYVYRARI
jgi:hypothetical protein